MKKECIIYSPMKGKCVPLSMVPDQVFCEEQLGPGIAFIPSDGNVYAPVDGTISMMFPTGHALGLITKNGVEILLHIGLDTVELQGIPFKTNVKTGQKVNRGDLLIQVDLEYIRKSGKNSITPLVICNPNEHAILDVKKEQNIDVGEMVLSVMYE